MRAGWIAILMSLCMAGAKLMQEATVRERFEAQGLEVAPPMTPDAFAAYVRSESERYAKLIPEIGLSK